MKLSELVHLKNQLDKLSTANAQEFTNSELAKITHLVNDSILEQDLVDLNTSFNIFNNTISRIKSDLKSAIVEAEKSWFQESYELYEGELVSPPEDILRIRSADCVNIDLFKSRLKLYTDWHHSAIVIRPGTESFIEDLVAFDPLYLVDLDHEYFLPALSRFNEQYQNRLRTYTISESLDQEILAKIPNNQFGFCLAYNYFNFRPFEILKKYLIELHNKLKPGGTFIMTFNDCDRASAVKLVEQYYSCYTPGYLVRELVQTMGYEIIYTWNDHGPVTWMELRKPGTLTSIKGGQSLGKIVPK
jgi:SAM-dependent methyltransferase